MKSLAILGDTAGVLVAEQKPQSVGPVPLILLVVAACVVCWLLWTKQWKLLVFPCVLMLIICIPIVSSKHPTYHLTVNRPQHTITSQATVSGNQVSAFQVSAHDLNSAEMQFNRGARTIVLVRRNGSLLYPLGEQQLQDEPNQYVVLNAIRQMIGQTPAPEAN